MDLTEREQRIQTICLLILATVAIAGALYWLRPVMIPFVLAVVFTMVLTPLVDLQVRRLRLPRPVAILTTVAMGLLILFLVGALVSTSIAKLASKADTYQAQVAQLFSRVTTALPLERFGVDLNIEGRELSERLVGTIGNVLVSTTNAVLGILSDGLLVMIFAIFLLVGGTVRVRPRGGVLGEVESHIKNYVIIKVLVSAATGVLVGVTLWLIGVDLALVFGLLAFLLNFIPNIGSAIATLLPLPVVIVNPETTVTTVVLVLLIPGVIQFLIGNVLEPMLMSESLELHPVVVLMALIFWGMLWGIVGMFLAVPLTAIMKILMEKLDLTAPIGSLLAGRLESLDAE